VEVFVPTRCDTFNLFGDASMINAGTAYWENACPDSQFGLPTFSANGVSSFNVYVTYDPGQSPATCGNGIVNSTLSGQITGGSIVVFGSDVNGLPCNPADTIAHEIGHFFGLDDVGAQCIPSVMAPGVYGQTRCVQDLECLEADLAWINSSEHGTGGGGTGGDDGGGGNVDDPFQICPDCPTPIVLNLDGGSFGFSGTDDPVLFDLTDTGLAAAYSWTAREGGDGFLALDVNANGTIDSGRELFGNHTPLPAGGTAENGYLALSAHDSIASGGNGDGLITANDAVFANLRIWIDWNHNGFSEPGELQTLASAGILSIEYSYHESARRDRHGNFIPYTSYALRQGPHGKTQRIRTCDVLFRPAP